MKRTKARLITVSILAIIGTVLYIICFFSHICMAGHLHHGPYSVFDWGNDLLWATCYAAVMVFSVPMRAKGKWWLICSVLLLTVSRLLLGSLGGGNILELPAVLIVFIIAIRSLVAPTRYIKQHEHYYDRPVPPADATPPQHPIIEQ